VLCFFVIVTMEKPKVNIRNKRASHDYEFLETYTAGIVLSGTEIKSIRAGKVSLVDTFCYFHRNELFVKGMNITEYWWGSYNNHEPRRDRKLLMNRRELDKLQRKSQEKGLTIIVFRLFINEKGLAKLDLALARGKKEYDKRETLKMKDATREMDRFMKK
jgi:SsrA-binding protein